ncbi:MAG: hypothetical protein Q9220_000423, partial [cf. Caloplaca sp. 1 TL-2023]
MARNRGNRGGNARIPGTKAGRAAGALSSSYQDLLNEVESSPTQTGDEGRVIKRRRVKGRIVTADADIQDNAEASHKSTKAREKGRGSTSKNGYHDTPEAEKPELRGRPLLQEQTTYKDESSEESDLAWEEVDLAPDPADVSEDQEVGEAASESEAHDQDQDLNLVLEDPSKHGSKQVSTNRKKPLTAAERKIRLDIHK